MFKNWVPTVGGLMAAIGGFPVALSTMGYHINQTLSLVMAIMGLLGVALLGISAKGVDQHSTLAQAEASQAVVEGKSNAPVLVKAANDQVAGK